jgi:hypothetical protein
VLILTDFQKQDTILKSFCELAEEEMLVTKGDPVSKLPIPESADPLQIITYLAYHLYIRLQLVVHCTEPFLRRTIEPQVTQSIAAVEEATTRLNVVQPGGGIKEVWDVAARTVSSYVTSGQENADNSLANSAICEAVELIDEELEIRYPSEVSPMVSYMQNIQALIKYGIDGSQIESSHVIIYLNNERRLPRGCFSEAYLASVDRLRPLMELVHLRQLTVDELQKIYLTFVWQTENVLTHFKSRRDIPGVLSPIDELPSDENQRITLLQETLKSLKTAAGILKYRKFVLCVHQEVIRVVDSEGNLSLSRINSYHSLYSAVSERTGLASQVLQILGYQKSQDGKCVTLGDYQSNSRILKEFLRMADQQLVVSVGDPAGLKPVDSIDHKARLVTHLAYHLHLRCGALPLSSAQHLLWSSSADIRASMALVDAIGDKLGIMKSGSEARRLWTTLQDDLSQYLATGDSGANRHRICKTLESMDASLRAEFMRIGILAPLAHVVGYVQNIGAIISLVLEHGHIPRENAETYVMVTSRLLPFSFSDEFMGVHKSVLDLVRKSFTGLREGELDQLYEQIVWMADNVLTYFQPEAHDAGNMSLALQALAQEIGIANLTFTSSVLGHQSNENLVPAQLSSTVQTIDSESDGEEKADVSEKNEKEKDFAVYEDNNVLAMNDEAVSLLSEYHQSDNTEEISKATQRLLSSVLSSEDWSKDPSLQESLAEIRRGNHMHLLEMEMESLSCKLRNAAEELEKEIGHLEAYCLETAPEIVHQALSSALSEKKCSLEVLTSQMTFLKAFRSHCCMVPSILRPRLHDFSKEELLSALSRVLESFKADTAVLCKLVKKVSPLLQF